MSDFNFSFGFTTDLTGLKSLEKEFDTISRKIDRIKDLKLNPNVNTSQLERLDRVQTALFGRLDLIQRAYVELDSAMNQAGSEGKALERVFVRLTEAAARESRVLGDLTGHFRNVDVAMEAMINPQLNSFLGNLELALNRVSLAVENHSDALREENALTQRNIDLKQAQMRATQASVEARRVAAQQNTAQLADAGLFGGDANEILDRLGGTVKQALISTPIYAAAYAATANIQTSIQSFIEFDTVLNRIAIVTSDTTANVREMKVAFMEAAKALSVSGIEYAKGTQTFLAQGGAAAKYAEDLTKAAVQLANVTGTSTQDTSDYLTAIGNSFKLIDQGPASIQKMADVLLYLDNASATSADEIGQAMRRAASSFESAGISYEKASAMIATSSEITRQAPERIGTAFKTMIETIQEVRKQGPESVKEFSSKIQETIDQFPSLKGKLSLFDESGTKMVDTTEFLNQLQNTFEEIKTTDPLAAKAVMQAIGGKENANILAALLESGDRYRELYEGIVSDSLGSAEKAQAEFANSLQAKINEMKGAWEEFINSLISSEGFANILESLESIAGIMHTLLGDSNQLLKILGAIAVIKFLPSATSGLLSAESLLPGFIKKRIVDTEAKAIKNPFKSYDEDNPKANTAFIYSLKPLREELARSRQALRDVEGELAKEVAHNRRINDLIIEEQNRAKFELAELRAIDQSVMNQVEKDELNRKIQDMRSRTTRVPDELHGALLETDVRQTELVERRGRLRGETGALESELESQRGRVSATRGTLGGIASAVAVGALTLVGDILSTPGDFSIKDLFKSFIDNIGSLLGSALVGGVGMALGGPAGAIVGANLGSWLGEWIQGKFDPSAMLAQKEELNKNVKAYAELQQKKIEGVALTKDEIELYSKLSIELAAYTEEVVNARNMIAALHEANKLVTQSSKEYYDSIAVALSGATEKYEKYGKAVERAAAIEQKQLLVDYVNKYITDEEEKEKIISDINEAMSSESPSEALTDLVTGGKKKRGGGYKYESSKILQESYEDEDVAAKELRSQMRLKEVKSSEYFTKSGLTADVILKNLETAPLESSIDKVADLGKEYGFSFPVDQLKKNEDKTLVKKSIENTLNTIKAIAELDKRVKALMDDPTEEAKALVDEQTKIVEGYSGANASEFIQVSSAESEAQKYRGILEKETQRQQKLEKEFFDKLSFSDSFTYALVDRSHARFDVYAVEYDKIMKKYVGPERDKMLQAFYEKFADEVNLDSEQLEGIMPYITNMLESFRTTNLAKANIAAPKPQVYMYNPRGVGQSTGPLTNIFSQMAQKQMNIPITAGATPSSTEPVKETFKRPTDLLELSQIDVGAEQNRIVKLINDKIQNIKDGNGTAEEKLKELEKLYLRRLKLLKSAKDSYKNALNISKKNLQDIVNQDKGILKGISLKEAGDGFFDENSIQRIRQRLELNVRSSQSGLAGLGEKTDQNNNSFVRAEKAVYNAEQALEKFNKAHSAYQTSVEKSNEANEALTDTLREQKKEIVSMQQEILEVDLTEAFFGKNKSLDKIEQYFNLITAQQNKYASALEKQLHLSKLQAQLDKDKLKYGTNPQLLAFQAKLNKAKDDGRKYSEEELKIIDSEYQVYLKQVMLKRAEQQANAGTVLMRDAAGNWIYGAKPGEKGKEDVLDANEDLTDAIDDLNRQLEAAITNTNKSLLDTTKQLIGIEKEIALNTTIANDKTGTYSDKEQKAAQERLKQLEGIQQALRGQLMIDQDSLKNLADKASVTAALGAAQATGAAATRDAILKESDLEAAKKIATNLSESSQALITSQLAPVKDQVATLGTTLTNLDGALKVVSEKLAGKDGLKTDFENISDVSQKVIAALGKEGKESTGLVGAIKSVDTIIGKTKKAIETKLTEFDKAARTTIESINDAGKLFEKSITAAGDKAVSAINKAASKIDASKAAVVTAAVQNAEKKAQYEGVKSALQGDQAKYEAQIKSFQAEIKDLNTQIKTQKTLSNNPLNPAEIAALISKRSEAEEGLESSIAYLEATKKALVKLDTGGYTGDFSGGKMAMLHEKELVLNKEDTKNILNSVRIIREVASSVNPKEIFSSIPSSEVSNSTIINASFPNVSSSEEIRKAFANMSNNASQFAYRMRPAY